MHWILTTVLVCCYGFFKDFRPSDGYLTEFLTSEFKNLTLDQVNNEIYPCKTYSYAVSLLPILMFADYFKYRSLLILDVVLYSITWILVLWSGGILAMKSMQVVYGLASAGEIGYFYYLYPLVDKEHYQKCSSFVRFSCSSGRCLAYLLGQLFLSYDVLDFFGLNAFSLSSVLFAFVISIFLPKSKTIIIIDHSSKTEVTENNTLNENLKASCDNHSNSENSEKQNNCTIKSKAIPSKARDTTKCSKPPTTSTKTECFDCPLFVISNNTDTHYCDVDSINSKHMSSTFRQDMQLPPKRVTNVTFKQVFPWLRQIAQQFKNRVKSAYSNRTVILWSSWWMTASCGNFQIGSYIQNIWEFILPHKDYEEQYNGAVEATGTLLGALFVFLVGFLPLQLSKVGRSEVFMTGACVTKAVLFAVLATTTNIWVAYVSYCLFKVLFQVAVTIESAEIAKAIDGSYFGFVFGCNMFVALVVETVFTAVIVDEAGLGLDVRKQFLAYSGYSGMLSAIFLVITIVTVCKKSEQPSEDIVNRL